MTAIDFTARGLARRLETGLSSSDAGQGASLVSAPDCWGAPYLQTLSDIANTQSASPLFWIPREFHSKILDGSSTEEVGPYLQDAIDTLEAGYDGATLLFPDGRYNVNGVTLKRGVTLLAAATMRGHPGGYKWGVRFLNNGPGWTVDTPATPVTGLSVRGIAFEGRPGMGSGGLRFRDCYDGKVLDCFFDVFDWSGFIHESGNVLRIDGIFGQNLLLDRSPTSFVGAIDIAGHDHSIGRIEATTSQIGVGHAGSGLSGDGSDNNTNLAAIVIRGGNCSVSDIIGEISGTGVVVMGDGNHFANSRADLNFGGGWVISGSYNVFNGIKSFSNGQGSDATYDEIVVTGTRNIFNSGYVRRVPNGD